jgi:hypothetical protein
MVAEDPIAETRDALAKRVARLEQLVLNQQTIIAEQSAKIAQLEVGQSTTQPTSPSEQPASTATVPRNRASRRTRRAVLKLGGAAAAAGVAAVAGAATELAHPDSARAAGVAWQTGTVSADTVTKVVPADPSFPDPELLLLSMGDPIAAYRPLTTARSASITAYDPGMVGGRYGVYATSHTGAAVFGAADTGAGVVAESNSGQGLFATSGQNAAVWASSMQYYGAILSGGLAPLQLVPSASSGAPTTGAHLGGELYVDSAKTLWFCIADGTPGVWTRLSGPLSGVPTGLVHYLVTPIRLYDTRSFASAPLPFPRGTAQGGSLYSIQVTGTVVGGISVPAGATGVFGNLTVTNAQGGGDLVLFPFGAPQPSTSNINYVAGQTVANFAGVGLSSDGKMELYVHVSSTDVIFDVAGYVM